MTTKPIKALYKILRSILLSAVLTIVGIYLLIYIFLASPWVQGRICEVAETELSKLLGGSVEIGEVSVMPFNEVVVKEISLRDPQGGRVATVETLGAGLSLTKLLFDRRLEFSYAEIIGLDVVLWQREENGPLNIDYIIKALQPKDRNKPPTAFDLTLRNIVIRRSSFSFDRMWCPRQPDTTRMDFNHIKVCDFKADLTLPRIANDDFTVDMRRLSLKTPEGFSLERLAFKGHLTKKSLSVENLMVQLPGTLVTPSDIHLSFDGYDNIARCLRDEPHRLVFVDNALTLSDLGAFVPELRKFDFPLVFSAGFEGDMSRLEVTDFSVSDTEGDILIGFGGEVERLDRIAELKADLDDLNVHVSRKAAESLLAMSGLDSRLPVDLSALGFANVRGEGSLDMSRGEALADVKITTSLGDINIDGVMRGIGKAVKGFSANVDVMRFEAGPLLRQPMLGQVTLTADADVSFAGKIPDGRVSADMTQLEWNGLEVGGIIASVNKTGDEIEGNVDVDNHLVSLEADAGCLLAGPGSEWRVSADLGYLNPLFVKLPTPFADCVFSGRCYGVVTGNNIENMYGRVLLSDLSARTSGRTLTLRRTLVEASEPVDNLRDVTLHSDWLSASVHGVYSYRGIAPDILAMVSEIMPSLIPVVPEEHVGTTDARFDVRISPSVEAADFFNIPVRPLTDVNISGYLDAPEGQGAVNLTAPYLQQGEKKLIQGTELKAFLNTPANSGNIWLTTVYPTKKGELEIEADITARDNFVMATLGCNPNRKTSFRGELQFTADISRDSLDNSLMVDACIQPSRFELNKALWNVAGSRMLYGDKRISVDGFRVWHDDQYVEIEGVASPDPDDRVEVRLNDIDVGFIFDTLNINYVTFGGVATGEVVASGVLSPEPVAMTKYLNIKDMSYNGAVLGDGELESHWDNAAKRVAIGALITEGGKRRARIDGGIWLTRDSLSFGIDANHVNVAFLQPFMAAFASDVGGAASGRAKLFGTFSDIDLVGRLKADDTRVRLGYTNVEYHANDSVIFEPGRIVIDNFTVSDRYGNTAMLNGELTHRYFHDPRFEFKLSQARSLLVYDTNEQINPDWYGTIFASGTGLVRGWPGIVMISVDMSTARNSRFTFVLNDTEAVSDYNFLTFTDVRKEKMMAEADTVPDFLKAFRENKSLIEGSPSVVDFDLRMSVTPDALLTLVMDPVGGDKITARGSGPVNIPYNSETDVMNIYGKYTVEEGTYNFTLQDLILRDFTIRPGSSISFDGDPMDATLDMAASYRVNTNLSDLDKSFSTDRDLNRTNVPVDAVLIVTGKMQSPNIDFDIQLPTLTQDVERKVKSIISTDDQMSRQIIYLLALNRFYTPEYMGNTANSGAELAAVASSTISSQLSSMLGQLTDKVSLAPSIRSDKGDFSDVEVDLALSSRLLDNRLLVNGNFGYRDRTTSTTTFVGDFDIEYLLSRNGGLRLKAYNHFNDQNYYLRSALTTQGLGVIYRHDFDHPFTFLKRRRRKESKEERNRQENAVNNVEKNGDTETDVKNVEEESKK